MLEVVFQGTDALRLMGYISALLSVCAFIPYVTDTIIGRTRPQRASWLIWSILGCIAFASQAVEGAGASLWFIGIQVGATVLIFGLSLFRGQGVFCNPRDGLILVGAAAGLALWALTDTAAYALAITILIALLGGSVTVLKAYRQPESETLSTWILCFAASWCAILSVGKMNWILLVYPMYLFTLNGAIVVAIMLGRAARRAPAMIQAE